MRDSQGVPKRVHIAVACLVILLADFFLWEGLCEHEPNYRGKSLSFWLTPPADTGSLNYVDWQERKHEATKRSQSCRPRCQGGREMIMGKGLKITVTVSIDRHIA